MGRLKTINDMKEYKKLYARKNYEKYYNNLKLTKYKGVYNYMSNLRRQQILRRLNGEELGKVWNKSIVKYNIIYDETTNKYI